ncbi:MAG: excinuclease ABC subunit UvrA, partial [Chloroflexota bacterium]
MSSNPRSTVGTVTEIYDYMRLLFARVGIPHCPVCGEEVVAQSAQQIVDEIKNMPHRSRVQVLAPVVKNRKGTHEKTIEDIRKAGFARVRVDGEVREIDDDIQMDRYVIHNIEIVVDRLIIRQFDDPESEEAQSAESRLTDAVETALEQGDGALIINDITEDEPRDIMYSEHFACPNGHGSLPELEPRLFSFNTPKGACPDCQGLGFRLEVDPNMIVPNPDLSILDGAVDANGWTMEEGSWNRAILESISKTYKVPLDAPWRNLTKKQRDVMLYGTGKKKITINYQNRYGNKRTYETNFEGVINNLMRRYEETSSDYIRDKIESYMAQVPCKTCGGE